ESCIYSEDLDGIRAFYEGILGLPVIAHVPEELVFFRAGNSMLLCFNPERSAYKEEPPPHYGKGQLHLAFETEKATYKSWKEALPKKGVLIEQVRPWKNGEKESFYFRDPAGNLVEILQKGIWDPNG
ncbi:MAG: VOC family protein, partial [Flavobacteriales bacterium]